MKNLMYILSAALIALTGCKKGWLDQKPDLALTVPTTIEEYQLLLDNRTVFGVNLPGLGELGTDDIYLTDAIWNSLGSPLERNSYIWAKDVFQGAQVGIWNSGYKQILQANIVLDGIEGLAGKVGPETVAYNSLKGQALFYRAVCYWMLADHFCRPYDGTEPNGLGLPLNLDSQLAKVLGRSTLKQTYDQIISDLTQAESLLPESVPSPTRPSATAGRAMLARVYLAMDDYGKALFWASKVKGSRESLLDYSSLDPTLSSPIPTFNREVIWHAETSQYTAHTNLVGLVDTLLFDSYSQDDLRKSILYSQSAKGIQFRGNYRGTRFFPFCGLTHAEVLLIMAECQVRTGRSGEGMETLGVLLKNRYQGDPELALAQDPLDRVLQERRKELAFRSIRWSDLRRLNRDPRYAKVITRQLNGSRYRLEPNSGLYVYPIPENEVQYNKLEQNPR